MIYVDESVFPYKNKYYCHMFSDNSVEELHEMASKLGLKRAWFQENKKHFPHYDLSPTKRELAVALGAKEITCREMVYLSKQGIYDA